MIAKVCKRGRSATGLLRYLTGDSKTDHVVLDDANAQRLNAPSAQRPDIERPIWHAALSLPEGERLDAQEWHAVATEFLGRMGLSGHEWAAVVHNETGHQHCHIIANRIGYGGMVWAGEWDGKRAIEAAKVIETAHDLTAEAHIPTGRAALSQAEIERALRTETQPTRTTLQTIIDLACADRCATRTFLERLEAEGVGVVPNIASTGRVSGLAFEYNGEIFKGSQLGKAYAWGQLQTRITYEQERDSAALQERAGNRGRGPGESAGTGGRDSGRDGGTGPVHARHHEPDERGSGAGSPTHRDNPRHSEKHRPGAGRDSRDTERDRPPLAGHSRPDAPATGRPVSALARGRRPVSNSRQRISGLAAALVARFEAEQSTATLSHDRHGPTGDRNHQPVAAVPAPGHDRDR